MFDATGNPKQISANRQQTAADPDQELLHESNAILRSFYDSAPMMMGVVEILDGDILHLSDNAATRRFMGLAEDTTRNRLASELGMPEESIAEWLRHYRECVRIRGSVRFNYAHRLSDDIRWLSVTVSYITTAAEGRSRCSYIVEDVTEQKRAAELMEQQSEALAAGRQRLQTLINHFPNGAVVLFDHDLRFVVAGGQGFADTGMPDDFLEGKTVWEAFDPEIAAINDPLMRAALAGKASTVEVNYSQRIYEVSVLPIRNAEGDVTAGMTITQDITARKQAETERERLLDEVQALNSRLRRSVQETHHRVKNNLQVISALAELQVEAEDMLVPAAALRRIGQHTRALAALHDLLTQEAKNSLETDSISTKAALDKLIPLLQSTIGERPIRCEVADFRLSVREGASLALLISELVSNAVKHGGTEVEVRLTVRAETACLEVSDDGPGFLPGFDWQKAANTGLGLIDATGRYDLRGTVTFGSRPQGGAKVSVLFPMPSDSAE